MLVPLALIRLLLMKKAAMWESISSRESGKQYEISDLSQMSP